MSRARSLVAGVIAIAISVVAACTPSLDDGTPCGQAAELLGTCGVLLPFAMASGAACTGDQEAIATCITRAGSSCDALAALGTHLSDCVSGDAGTIPDSVPNVAASLLDASAAALGDAGSFFAGNDAGEATSEDASVRDSGARDDATAPITIADAGAMTDSAAPPVTTPDASPAAILDVSGTVAAGGSQPFQTPRLGIGSYTFTISGNANAVMTVRKGFAPTATTFDCTIDADTAGATCPETVDKSAILYAVVEGKGSSSSSFHLVVTTDPPASQSVSK